MALDIKDTPSWTCPVNLLRIHEDMVGRTYVLHGNSFGNLNVSQHTEQIFSSFMTSSKMEIEIWSFEITCNHISDADLDMFSSCSPLAAGQQLLTVCLTGHKRSLNTCSYVSATAPPFTAPKICICLHICCTVFNSSKLLNMAAIPPFGLYPVPTDAQGFAQCDLWRILSMGGHYPTQNTKNS